MDSKLKRLYLADLTAFGLTIFASTINHAPLMVAGSVAGLGISSYLVSVVPDKKARELETQSQFLEVQKQLENVTAERDWLESLSASQSQKLINTHREEIDTLQAQLEATERKLATEKRVRKDAIEKAKEGKKKALANQSAKLEREIANIKAMADERIAELEGEVATLTDRLKALELECAGKIAEVEDRANYLKKIEEALQKQSAEISLSEKALRLEEKRIGLDVRDERGQTLQHLETAKQEIEALNILATRMQAELATVRQTNRELWAAQYDKETDTRTAKVQGILAAAGCPTELLSSDSSAIVLRPNSIDSWDLKAIESAAQQMPAFVDGMLSPPKVQLQDGKIQLLLEYKEPATTNKKVEFYDWNDAKTEASGFIIAGNTGFGKTAFALWLLGLLTEDSPKQIVVLDVHAKMNHWHEHGLHVIHKQSDVIQALTAILNELNRRKEHGINTPELITVFEEVAATRQNCESKEEKEFVANTLLLIGAEGRKFGITLVAVNQSKNTAQLGIDAQNRNNYALILVGAAARDWSFYKWGENDFRTRHLQNTAYPCLVSGSLSDQVAKHPTHGDYKQFKKQGLKPKNLKSINALAPVVKGLPKTTVRSITPDSSEPLQDNDYPLLTAADNSPDSGFGQRTESTDKLAQIERFWAEGERRLSIIIPAIWGCDSSGRAYRKARREFNKLVGE